MTIIRLRRNTAAGAASSNPTLAAGEPGFETDTKVFKIGDGTTAWNDLDPIGGGAGASSWNDLDDRPAPLVAGSNTANGYPQLDGTGKIGTAQMPLSAMEYKGTWNASTNSPSLADGGGNTGDFYRVGTGATRNLGSGSIVFDVGDYVLYNGTIWEKSDTTDAVASVAGLFGVIAAAALTDALVDGSVNHVFTAADDAKLGGIEALADVTDGPNVDAAGAVMNTDTSTAAMGFVSAAVSVSPTTIPTNLAVQTALDLKANKVNQRHIPVAVGTIMTRYGIIQSPYSGTSRKPIYFPFACTNLRALFTNWKASTFGTADGDKTTLAQMHVRCAFEYAGVNHQWTFNGSPEAKVSPFGSVESDPLAVDVAAGTYGYVRTYTDSINSYGNSITYSPGGGGFNYNDIDQTMSGTITEIGGTYNTPSVIYGDPLVPVASVYAKGDSIFAAYGDGGNQYPFNDTYSKAGRGGIMGRAAITHGFGLLNVGVGGEAASIWNANGDERRGAYVEDCDNVVNDLGNNDLYLNYNVSAAGGYASNATIADMVINWWADKKRGKRSFATTLFPRANVSTDGFITVANQTITAGNAERVLVNLWLRNGAPITIATGLAAATGVSPGAGITRCKYLTGNTVTKAAENADSHPLYAVWETAAIVEDTGTPGKWKAPTTGPYGSRSTADGAATASPGNITSATAAFTTADLGKLVTLAGAGPGGTLYTGIVIYINSGTSIQVADNPSTIVSGAALKIIDHVTGDGAHGSPLSYQEIADAFPNTHLYVPA